MTIGLLELLKLFYLATPFYPSKYFFRDEFLNIDIRIETFPDNQLFENNSLVPNWFRINFHSSTNFFVLRDPRRTRALIRVITMN